MDREENTRVVIVGCGYPQQSLLKQILKSADTKVIIEGMPTIEEKEMPEIQQFFLEKEPKEKKNYKSNKWYAKFTKK